MFFRLSTTTNNNGKSNLATQDCIYLTGLVAGQFLLVMSYLVVHLYWINPWKFLSEVHLSFHFWMRIYLLFPGVAIHVVWSMCVFPHLQVSPLALTSFGSLALWLTWMVSFHFKDHEAGSGSFNSFDVWNIKKMRSNDDGYWKCTFLVKIIKRA